MAAPRRPKKFVQGNVRNLSKAMAALQGAEGVVPAALLELRHKVEAKIESCFKTETDPYGQPWLPPSARYVRRELDDRERLSFKLLVRTGAMKSRTQVNIIDGRMVKAVNRFPTAHLHQGGTQRRKPGGLLVPRKFMPKTGEMPDRWLRDFKGVPAAMMRAAGVK